jgi:hypothetical protein
MGPSQCLDEIQGFRDWEERNTFILSGNFYAPSTSISSFMSGSYRLYFKLLSDFKTT